MYNLCLLTILTTADGLVITFLLRTSLNYIAAINGHTDAYAKHLAFRTDSLQQDRKTPVSNRQRIWVYAEPMHSTR
uniref:Putative secreted protein n=1 Tax=Anopheles darlingi TaxID=43151 RepID=A0A2M4DHT6_ANODA